MIDNIKVEVEPRSEVGKNANRRLREAGRVPGIVYGLGGDSFMVAVSPRRVDDLLRMESGQNTIFTLALSGSDKSRSAMIKDLQRDPLTGNVVHVDFIRIDLKKTLKVEVPVRLMGTPDGVKNEGGMLDFILRQVHVECLPTAIPDHLDADVSGLKLNQHVAIKDLGVGEGVTISDDEETIIAVVVPPKAEVEEEPEEAEEVAEGAEPEVAAKGKDAGEGGGEGEASGD